MDLILEGHGPLAERIFNAVKRKILDGELVAGRRLPSSRDLAANLNVARGTVVSAYELLDAEGYIVSRGRSGSYVAPSVVRAAPIIHVDSNTGADRHQIRWRPENGTASFDLRAGFPSPDDFPQAVWNRLLRQSLARQAESTFDYPHPEGLPQLRSVIADYLARHRGLRCTADEILITNGAQQAFSLIARCFLSPGDPVLVENPGYPGFWAAARNAKAELIGAPVDEEGLQIDPAIASKAKIIYTTPAHQFPCGAILSITRRQQLVSIARKSGALIVEDDYDSEYRYGGPPIQPLKVMDTDGCVCFVGSFSKTIGPALRIGYIVATGKILDRLAAQKNIEDAGTSPLTQIVLADFIDQGHYERHLRRSRKSNARRRSAAIAALDDAFGDDIEILGARAGLHFVGMINRSHAPRTKMQRALMETGILIYDLAGFHLSRAQRRGFLFGYARMDERDLRLGLKNFAAIVKSES